MSNPGHLNGLDDLDAERPGQPFVVHIEGRTLVFKPAAGIASWQELVTALGEWPLFLHLVGPADPDDVRLVERLPVWKMRHLVRSWRVHHGLCAHNRDHWRLIGMLGKPAYRSGVERDLYEVYGLDLAMEWQQRRWRRLLNLIDGLRRTSHLHEAMTQDDALAEELLQRQRGDKASAPARRRMCEFSVEAELLSHTVDRIGELIQTVGATKGARRRRIPPMPRPETAMQRARQRQAQRKHRFTVARVFGYIDAAGRPTGKTANGDGPATC